MTCSFCGGDDPAHYPADCAARIRSERRAAWVAFAAAAMHLEHVEAPMDADAMLAEYDVRVKDGRL